MSVANNLLICALKFFTAYNGSMQKTVAVINVKNLVNNALFVRKIIGKRVFYAVVKADAYGHGAAEVALALESYVDGFCVAITDEGVALRLSGVSKPVLVLTPPLGKDDVRRAEFYNLTPTVNSAETAAMIGDLPCHIKVNTGMNRFGCSVEDLPQILRALAPEQIAGVYSHMYNPLDCAASLKQLYLFNAAEREIKKINPYAVSHFAASGGILAAGGSGFSAAMDGNDLLKDGVRCGILLYGYPPEGFCADVKPVLKVYARRAQTTRFIGGGIGYARAENVYENLSVYRLGYADGFARGVKLGESPLCMDSFISRGGEDLKLVFCDAASYAKECGTIPYEALCSVTKRAEKVYVYE